LADTFGFVGFFALSGFDLDREEKYPRPAVIDGSETTASVSVVDRGTLALALGVDDWVDEFFVWGCSTLRRLVAGGFTLAWRAPILAAAVLLVEFEVIAGGPGVCTGGVLKFSCATVPTAATPDSLPTSRVCSVVELSPTGACMLAVSGGSAVRFRGLI